MLLKCCQRTSTSPSKGFLLLPSIQYVRVGMAMPSAGCYSPSRSYCPPGVTSNPASRTARWRRGAAEVSVLGRTASLWHLPSVASSCGDRSSLIQTRA